MRRRVRTKTGGRLPGRRRASVNHLTARVPPPRVSDEEAHSLHSADDLAIKGFDGVAAPPLLLAEVLSLCLDRLSPDVDSEVRTGS